MCAPRPVDPCSADCARPFGAPVMVGEDSRVRLPGMIPTATASWNQRRTETTPSAAPRRRPTDAMRESSRLSAAVAGALGHGVKAGRKRLRLTQAELAERVGVHQSWISRIELGRGGSAPLELWVRLGVVLGQPLAATFTRPLGEARQLSDAGHLEMQEYLLGLVRSTGRAATFELPTRPSDPTRSIDVCVRDASNRVLIVEEAWNTFGDLGAAIRSTHRKVAEAADLAATIDEGPPYRVAAVWVVREHAANRAIVARYPEVMHGAFAGPSRAWAQALTSGTAPPALPGLVWYDSSTHRIHEWRSRRAGAIAPPMERGGRTVGMTLTAAVLGRLAAVLEAPTTTSRSSPPKLGRRSSGTPSGALTSPSRGRQTAETVTCGSGEPRVLRPSSH